jgi:hypothetical protein
MNNCLPSASSKPAYGVPLGFAVLLLVGSVIYREHRAALTAARQLTRAHLHSVGVGDVDTAMQHYGSEVFAGPKRSPDGLRGSLSRLRGLKLCEEYLGVATLWHGQRGLGWYAHVSYRTAYTNRPVEMGFEEVFDVFCPLTGTNCIIIEHWYD